VCEEDKQSFLHRRCEKGRERGEEKRGEEGEKRVPLLRLPVPLNFGCGWPLADWGREGAAPRRSRGEKIECPSKRDGLDPPLPTR